MTDKVMKEVGKALALLGEGSPTGAKKKLEKALVHARKQGDRTAEAGILAYLGEADVQLGRLQEAVGTLQQAHSLAQEVGNRPFQAQALRTLGVAAYKLGRPRDALDFLEAALSLYRAMGDPLAETIVPITESIRRDLGQA